MKQQKLEDTTVSLTVVEVSVFVASSTPEVLHLTVSYAWTKIINALSLTNTFYVKRQEHVVNRWSRRKIKQTFLIIHM